MLGGVVKIIDLDGEEMFQPIQMDRLWKYNPWKEKKKSPPCWKPKRAA